MKNCMPKPDFYFSDKKISPFLHTQKRASDLRLILLLLCAHNHYNEGCFFVKLGCGFFVDFWVLAKIKSLGRLYIKS
jgi:hypothetical protein